MLNPSLQLQDRVNQTVSKWKFHLEQHHLYIILKNVYKNIVSKGSEIENLVET